MELVCTLARRNVLNAMSRHPCCESGALLVWHLFCRINPIAILCKAHVHALLQCYRRLLATCHSKQSTVILKNYSRMKIKKHKRTEIWKFVARAVKRQYGNDKRIHQPVPPHCHRPRFLRSRSLKHSALISSSLYLGVGMPKFAFEDCFYYAQ